MARVYSSRIMLDPSVLQNMNNIVQQRYQNEAARRQSVLSPMRDLLYGAGNTFDTWLERKEREWELSDSENTNDIKKMAENLGIDLSSATKDGDNTVINLNDNLKSKLQAYSSFIPDEYKKFIDLENNRISIPTKMLEASNNSNMRDPIYRAARNEYIRTGNSQPLMSYQMQKLAAEERLRAAEKAEAEKKYQKELHDAVTLREDRNKYGQLQANMFKAMDEGNMADAQTYKNQMEGLEQHYAKYYPNYTNPFGDTAQSMWDARSEQKRLADEKRAQEEADKQELELGEKNLKAIQDINEQERLYKVEQFLSTLPTVFKNDAEKQKVYDLINNNEDMNTAEKAAMLKKVRETDSGETAKKKAKQGVRATKAGEATGAAIDEAKNKENASHYAGKKLNSLEWNKIPDEQKKYLIRDAAGNVSMKE